MITAVERHIDRGLGLVLPVLVVVSDLLPLATLAFAPLPAWLAIAAVASFAVGACAYLLRARGVGVALGLSIVGVMGGAGLFALAMMGLRAMGDFDGAVQDAANTLVMVFPLILVALALIAAALSFRALPADRIALAIAWVVAIAAPFVLAYPIGYLSERAGNALMDLVALFVVPLAAFLVWSFMLAGSLMLGERAFPSADSTGV